jgi:peptidoglycan/LPS O-acetylase OafA/YrhL
MQPTRPSRLYYLDGLRGWAALVVVFYHATWELFGVCLPQIRIQYLSLANDGSLAVNVFFVLSGIVLTQSFLRTKAFSTVQRMALARYPRLAVPVAAASFICFLLIRSGLMFNQQAVDVVNRPDWLGLFYAQTPTVFSWARFSAYDVFFDYSIRNSYDSFLWTMPIEMKGSFVLFAGLLLSGSATSARWLYGGAALLLTQMEQPLLAPFVYGLAIADFMTSPFYDRIAHGALGNVLGFVSFGAAALMSGLFRTSHHGDRICGALAFAVVLGVVLSPRLRSFFQSGLSRWLGHISFPLYLIHSLVLCSLSCWSIIWLSHHEWSLSAIAGLVVPLTISASLLAAWLFSPVEHLAIKASHGFANLVLRTAPSKTRRSSEG